MRLGAYTVQAELARGAMGVVYRAHDPALDRPLALKVIRSEDARDPEAQQRFLREVRILAKLRHPHVIGVHAAGLSEHGYPFLAMDLIEGGTLRDRLAAPGEGLPLEEAVRIAVQLADALDYAHRQGVLHRDLKPHNVLMDGEDAVLTDFGLAKLLGADAEGLTLSGERIGTPAYMAPEQVRGDHAWIGPATDVYGLGATLFQMLTGNLPFPGDSVVEVFARIRQDPAASARAMRPEVDPELEGIVQTCLEKQPDDRYPSAAALKKALVAWQVARDPNASFVGASALAPRPARRWPLALALLLGLALGGALAFPIEQLWRRDVMVEELPDELRARYSRGTERYLRDDLQGAIEDFDYVIAQEPDCGAAWYRRGQCKSAQEKPEEAVADLTVAVEIDPEFARGFNQRAQARPVEDDEARLADYARAIELRPHPVWFHNRASQHFKQERYDQAKADIERALELDPRQGQSYLLRGMIKKRTGDEQGALEDYQLAVAYGPKDANALNARGVLRSALGDQTGAAADFRAAIAAALKTPQFHINRAFVFEKRAELLRALADLDVAIDVDPKNGQTYNRRAVIHIQLSRWRDAIADLKRAAELLTPEDDERLSLTKTARMLERSLDAGVYQVNVPSIELRVGSNEGQPVIADLRKGARVKLLKREKNGWSKVLLRTPDNRRFEGYLPHSTLVIVVQHDPTPPPPPPEDTEPR